MKTLDLSGVGARVSSIRKQRGITLKEMAEYTGLSVGFLSNLETGKTSPTLENLGMVTNTLQVDFVDLITEEKQKNLVITRDKMKTYMHSAYNMEIQMIDFGYDPQVYELISIEPGEVRNNPKARHIYPETCFVLEGELTIEVDGKLYILHKFDSIYIPAQSQHRMWNETDETVLSYWVYQKKS